MGGSNINREVIRFTGYKMGGTALKTSLVMDTGDVFDLNESVIEQFEEVNLWMNNNIKN